MPNTYRIAVLINRLHWGGAEKLLYDVLNRNRDQNTGIEYFVYALESGNLEVQIRELGYPVRILEHRHQSDLSVARQLCRELSYERINLLHSHLPRSGIIGRLAAKMVRIPSVYTEHNLWIGYRWQSRYLHLATLPLEKRIIAVSKPVQSAILNVHPWLRHKTTVVVNGVDLMGLRSNIGNQQDLRQQFGIRTDKRIILNVANLRPAKDHLNLIKAFSLLANQVGSHLLIVGRDDGIGETLKRAAQELGIADQITFAGPRDDVPQLMAGADIFVLSSVVEGLPVTLLEASALGIPSVVTAVGGIPEVIVDGKNGWLVPPRNPEALSRSLLEALQNQDKAQSRGQAAQRLMQDSYSIERMIEQHTVIYRQVLATTTHG